MERDNRAVVLVESRHEWVELAGQMAGWLARLLPGAQIEHIGSTAVPGLPAKDVVDLLVGVAEDEIAAAARRLADAGFDQEGGLAHHCWLAHPDRTDRRYVVHVVARGGRRWQRRIDFRDLLRRDPAARRAYLEVKQAAARDAADWDQYTQSKTAVVHRLLDRST